MNWCLQQKEGISLIDPNLNLAEAYIKKAEDSLESIGINKIKEWKISTAYYAMYFSLYAVLMRIGIKCGIHSCTLKFARDYLNEFFSEDKIDFLEDSLKARIDSQYYVNRAAPDKQFHDMVKKAPGFFVNCKSIILKLTEDKINKIRSKLKNVIKRTQ